MNTPPFFVNFDATSLGVSPAAPIEWSESAFSGAPQVVASLGGIDRASVDVALTTQGWNPPDGGLQNDLNRVQRAKRAQAFLAKLLPGQAPRR